MPNAEPFVRESGAGPAVVCIHANAGTSGQWRALMDGLSPTHHVLAPDCYGAGKSPAWSGERLMTLRDEVDCFVTLFRRSHCAVAIQSANRPTHPKRSRCRPRLFRSRWRPQQSCDGEHSIHWSNSPGALPNRPSAQPSHQRAGDNGFGACRAHSYGAHALPYSWGQRPSSWRRLGGVHRPQSRGSPGHRRQWRH